MLLEAIQSAKAQDYKDFEHIIVDGGSTDGTLEALQSHPDLKIISEPDQGVYDAMNKGIKAAKGEIIVLLNSDDILPEGTLKYAAKYFDQTPDLDALYGPSEITNMHGDLLETISDTDILNMQKCPDTSFPVSINSRFLKKSLYKKLGYFSLKYARAADHDLILRLKHTPHNYQTTTRVLYTYRSHDGSLTIRENFADASMWEEYLNVALNGIEQSKRNSALWKDYRNLLAWSLFRCVLKGRLNNNQIRQALKACPALPLFIIPITAKKIKNKIEARRK